MQIYTRTDHVRTLGKLPAEARQGLRYYEILALEEGFTPYPPMQGANLEGRSYVIVVVTDWSLLFLSPDGKYDQAVLLELPLLGIEDLVGAAEEEGGRQ